VRETGDLGQVAGQLLTLTAVGRPASLQVTTVVDTLHRIAGSGGPGSQGRKLELLAGLLGQATPLGARYLLRLVTGGLRLGSARPPSWTRSRRCTPAGGAPGRSWNAPATSAAT
jgi:ATP-dependent DNA ligase